MKYCVYSLLFIVSALLFNCSGMKSFDSPDAMFKWINDPENGLKKGYENNGVKIEVKYLPAEYLSWQQINDEGVDAKKMDSLTKSNKNSRVFLMTISPGKDASGDIMYKDLGSVSDFKNRALSMNFDMSAYVEIKANQEVFKPVLASMENTYSTTTNRTIYLVFSDETKDRKLLSSDELDFVFNDELFNTGVNHLVYKKKEIDNIPALAFLK